MHLDIIVLVVLAAVAIWTELDKVRRPGIVQP